MNGILPGPLWLAIASAAAYDNTIENRTPPYKAKNVTVSGKTTDGQSEITVNGRKLTGDDQNMPNGG